MIMPQHECPPVVNVRFEVTTQIPLPVGEQVFISGNIEALGNWRPDGLPLMREADCLWVETIEVEKGQRIEFKVTRGSWETEQVNPDGSIPGNHEVVADADRTVRVSVANWKDSVPVPTAQIVGDYRVHASVASRYLRLARRVIVWLPPSYKNDPHKRYPVLYLQDGQQVFDPQTSTWQHDWQVDEWCTELIGEFRMEEIIVVAIYCTEDRYEEYNPSKRGKDYARFIVEELKPFIDSQYRTLPDRIHTFVGGASMGAVISFYLAWAHSDVFAGAVCLSPAFRYRGDSYCLDMVRETQQAPKEKFFFYCGEGDELDRSLLPGMREMVELLKGHGYREGTDFKAVVDPEGRHNEETWARYVPEWLLYFFGR